MNNRTFYNEVLRITTAIRVTRRSLRMRIWCLRV